MVKNKNKGWECPRCGVVWAPTIEKCTCVARAYVSYVPYYPYPYGQGPWRITTVPYQPYWIGGDFQGDNINFTNPNDGTTTKVNDLGTSYGGISPYSFTINSLEVGNNDN